MLSMSLSAIASIPFNQIHGKLSRIGSDFTKVKNESSKTILSLKEKPHSVTSERILFYI